MFSKVASKLHIRRRQRESQTAHHEQAESSISTDVAQALETGYGNAETDVHVKADVRQSIWNRAYDKIKEDEPKLGRKYEETLKKLLGLEDALSEQSVGINKSDRSVLMQQGIKVGLERTKKEAKAKGRLQKVMDVINPIKNVVTEAVKSCPQAALAWTGVCLTMEILANPISEFAAQREGIEYLMSRMEWYWRLTDTLFITDKEDKPFLRGSLEASTVLLFGKILAYQMKSINVYHQNRYLTTVGDIVKYGDWKKHLEGIKEKETQFGRDLEQYNSGTSRFYLEDISDSGKGIMKELQSWRSHQEDEECRNLINKSIPYLTKQDIENRRGGLLPECCDWFFGCTPFKDWNDDLDHGILWIRAAPGKGKTMLLCTIIDWLWEEAEYDPEEQKEIESDLVSRADDTFLWVALAYQHLSARKEYMQSIEEVRTNIKNMPKGLDNLYERMMEYICTLEPLERYKGILTVVCLTYRPLALQELQFLAKHRDIRNVGLDRLKKVIHQCGSFLTFQDESITFIHQSAKDFLIQRGAEPRFAILPPSIQEAHREICLRALENMSETLRRDIYGLNHPGTSATEVNAPDPDPLAPVSYSCVNWVNHILDSGHSNDRNVGNAICKLLHDHFLHWMEALSLLGEVSVGATAMRELKAYVVEDGSSGKELGDIVYDCYRFFFTFMHPVELAPLQAYASALIFAPSSSLVKTINQKQAPQWITPSFEVEADWRKDSLTSLSRDHAVVWDVKTGTRIRAYMCKSKADRAILSGNGQKAVWISSDEGQCIQIWDPFTEDIKIASVGGPDKHFNLWLSYDSRYLVAAGQYSLTVFDTTESLETPNQELRGRTLDGHHEIFSEAFLANTTTFVCVSPEGLVQIWDIITGQCLTTFNTDRKYCDIKSCLRNESRFFLSDQSFIQAWRCDGEEAQCLRTWEVNGSELLGVSETGELLSLTWGDQGKCLMGIWEVNCDNEYLQFDCGISSPSMVDFSREWSKGSHGNELNAPFVVGYHHLGYLLVFKTPNTKPQLQG
ncbi:Vegetative incompatibility protein HET-E-1 [Cladobotryum mycophilum]|uniref:Vegetative incompatibility protein HET-E-1 n=1 Tax=Cladobotryum mycophilum TaxID=491253 RepID=A0ABR0SQP3_9HYPO